MSEPLPCSAVLMPEEEKRIIAEEVWESLIGSGCFVKGEFTLASDVTATLKVEAEKLYANPEQLEAMVGRFATHPCIQMADVLLPVPDGMRAFTAMVGKQLDIPVAE